MKNTLVPLYKKININEELSEGRDVKNVALDIETKEPLLYSVLENDNIDRGAGLCKEKCQKYRRNSEDDPFMSSSINRSNQAATPRSPNVDFVIFSSTKRTEILQELASSFKLV